MDKKTLKDNGLRLTLLAIVCTGIATFFLLGGHHLLTFDQLVARKNTLLNLAEAHPGLAQLLFVAAYLILGIFALPGSTLLNITAGVLFDFWKGLFWVIVASTLASSLAFFSLRYLIRDYVEPKVRKHFPRVEETLEQESAYFVLAMRLFPVIPYSLTNLVLAISPVPFLTYLGMSLLALLPRYVLYVYAGTHLGDVQDPEDLFSPSITGTLAILAVIPWILKRVSPYIKNRFAKSK